MTQNPTQSKLNELHRSVANLLTPELSDLHEDIKNIQEQLAKVTALSDPLPENLKTLQDNLNKLIGKAKSIEQIVTILHDDLEDPKKVTEIVKLGLQPALEQDIKSNLIVYSKTIAPVITPAIRNQIRDSKDEMVEALSPIIGQTIAKAIAEAFQDFRRRLDAQLNKSLNIRERIQRMRAKSRGVSEADLLIRSTLAYTITHVFLIHRKTGLLLKQVSRNADRQDMDIISGMLTAIRDFAQDTFGQNESELEEIQFGNSHILLEAGQYAYLAVVVDGIQPTGFSTLLRNTIHEINVKHEVTLSSFHGDMDKLPDFTPELKLLLDPNLKNYDSLSGESESRKTGKASVWAIIAGLIFLLGLIIFSCVFSIRLLPTAFPAPTTTMTSIPSATSTLRPTKTNTVTPSPTPTYTPTLKPTPEITATQEVFLGVMTGNVWAHEGPDYSSERIPLVVATNTQVELKAIHNDWIKITWETGFGVQEGWVPQNYVGIPYSIPQSLVTPVR